MKGWLLLIALYGATYELIVRELRENNCTFSDVLYEIASHPSSSTAIFSNQGNTISNIVLLILSPVIHDVF